MTQKLTLRQAKLLVECALSKKGYSAASKIRGLDDDWQLLLNLGYVRKVGKRGMDDFVERFTATEKGTLRLTDPGMLAATEVMEA
jgi:hypothetical protein